MRVGLSWDLDAARGGVDAWRAAAAELAAADSLGYDSAWMEETHDSPVSATAPSFLLTAAAATAPTIQLRASGRRVGRHHAVRIAEEVVVLDLFSRGRAGICFASGSRQGVDPVQVHENIDLICTAWRTDEFRYRGKYVRFPKHTPDEAPYGPSEPPSHETYTPQWEWGPATPDYLAVTPKPYGPMPQVYVEIDDDLTLEWAATQGISPFVREAMPTDEAIRRLKRYHELAAAAGRPRWNVEPVLERRIVLDGASDTRTLGGASREIVDRIRQLRAQARFSHLVWRRSAAETGRTDLLSRFASEVQPLLQA